MYKSVSFDVNYILVGFTYNCPDFMDAHSNTKCNRDHGEPPTATNLRAHNLAKYEIPNVTSIQECPLLCSDALKEKWTKDRNESPGCCEWSSDNKCYWAFDDADDIYMGYDSMGPDSDPEGTRALLCTAGLNFLVQFYLII